MEFLRKKKGFTLIEILIVIAIIGMLSTLAVSGYIQYRKTMVLNLSADNFVSLINQSKSRTQNGDNNSQRFDFLKSELEGDGVVSDENVTKAEGNSKCYGFYFTKNKDNYYDLSSFEQDFKGQKTWINNNWSYVGCEDLDVNEVVFDPVVFDEDVNISSLFSNNGEPIESLFLRFSPPTASLDVKLGARPFTNDFTNFNAIKMSLTYLSDLKYQQVLNFDFKTKNASKEIN